MGFPHPDLLPPPPFRYLRRSAEDGVVLTGSLPAWLLIQGQPGDMSNELVVTNRDPRIGDLPLAKLWYLNDAGSLSAVALSKPNAPQCTRLEPLRPHHDPDFLRRIQRSRTADLSIDRPLPHAALEPCAQSCTHRAFVPEPHARIFPFTAPLGCYVYCRSDAPDDATGEDALMICSFNPGSGTTAKEGWYVAPDGTLVEVAKIALEDLPAGSQLDAPWLPKEHLARATLWYRSETRQWFFGPRPSDTAWSEGALSMFDYPLHVSIEHDGETNVTRRGSEI